MIIRRLMKYFGWGTAITLINILGIFLWGHTSPYYLESSIEKPFMVHLLIDIPGNWLLGISGAIIGKDMTAFELGIHGIYYQPIAVILLFLFYSSCGIFVITWWYKNIFKCKNWHQVIKSQFHTLMAVHAFGYGVAFLAITALFAICSSRLLLWLYSEFEPIGFFMSLLFSFPAALLAWLVECGLPFLLPPVQTYFEINFLPAIACLSACEGGLIAYLFMRKFRNKIPIWIIITISMIFIISIGQLNSPEICRKTENFIQNRLSEQSKNSDNSTLYPIRSRMQINYAYTYFLMLSWNVQFYFNEHAILPPSEFIVNYLNQPENEYIRSNFDLYYFPTGLVVESKIQWHLVGFDHVTKTFWCGRIGEALEAIDMIDTTRLEYFYQILSATNQNPIHSASGKDR